MQFSGSQDANTPWVKVQSEFWLGRRAASETAVVHVDLMSCEIAARKT